MTLENIVAALLLHPNLVFRNKSTIKSLNKFFQREIHDPKSREALRKLLARDENNKLFTYKKFIKLRKRNQKLLNDLLYI